MSLAHTLLGHSYQLLRPLGSGGTGTLYLAQDIHLNRQVAVKVVPVDAELQGNDRVFQRAEKLFHEKMQALAQLNHARIVPILDSSLEKHGAEVSFSVVMAYYPAGSLADRLAQSTTHLTPAEIASVLTQTAEALHAAHERELLHLDLKPSNLLLNSPSLHPAQAATFADLQLADFGLAPFFASLSSRGLSQSPYIRQTSMFIAPEQWDDRAVPASDQYALAIMAFFLLTGQYPFQGSLSQVIQQHHKTQPPAPSSLNRQVNPATDKILKRALAKQPEKRFPSVLEFAQAFASAQPGALALPIASPVPEPTSLYFPAPRAALPATTVPALSDETILPVAALAPTLAPSSEPVPVVQPLQLPAADPVSSANGGNPPDVFESEPEFEEIDDEITARLTLSPAAIIDEEPELEEIDDETTARLTLSPAAVIDEEPELEQIDHEITTRLTLSAPAAVSTSDATILASVPGNDEMKPVAQPPALASEAPTLYAQPPALVSDAQTVLAQGQSGTQRSFQTTRPANLPAIFPVALAIQPAAALASPSVPSFKQAPALAPILPILPRRAVAQQWQFSAFHRNLIVLALALVVLLGSGAFLLQSILAASHTQAGGPGQAGGNNGGITIIVTSTAPGQTPGAGSTSTPTTGSMPGSTSTPTNGSTPTTGSTPTNGSTPTTGSTPGTGSGPVPTVAPTSAPTPTPTPVPPKPTPTPTPHPCLIHSWSSTLSPTYSAGGTALYVSAYCHGTVTITLTAAPPSGGHEVDTQICYGMRTTNCSIWAKYTGTYVWHVVATGLKSGQIFYINNRCAACTGSAFKIYGEVKY